MKEKKQCLYCNRPKPEEEFSEEHVLPQAIGGNLEPTNPFKTNDVCRNCNSTCGLFVDTGFIKSWFTSVARVQDGMRHVKFSQEMLFPFQYMGTIEELSYDGKICEFWIGPTGDSVFHFHDEYPAVEDMPIIVGPAPNVRRHIDFGFAFIFVVPSNPVWWRPILRSFAVQFRGTTLYFANGNTPEGGLFSEIPKELLGLREQLKAATERSINTRISVTIDAELRFLGKLGLGLGHLFLKTGFSSSSDAQNLRDLMWARTRDQRGNAKVRGAGVFGGIDASLKRLLCWEAGHLVCLQLIPEGIALFTNFYGEQTATLQISTSTEFWREDYPERGIVFVVVPGLRRFVGPLSIEDFVSHKIGVAKNAELVALEESTPGHSDLPPTHLEKDQFCGHADALI